MKILRTIPTTRLLAIIAGLIIAVAGGTAIAFAAAGNGGVPPRESLAQALHQAATAPSPNGIFARITFTNHLIDSSDLQGTDPILSGASGRLWLSPSTHEMRLELQGDNGDAQVVVKNGAFSIYDPMSNVVYKGTLPADASTTNKTAKAATEPVPSVAQIQTQLNQLLAQLSVVGPTPRNVAGEPAYKVKLSPKHSGGLIGDVQLAWDATHGVPLGIAIYSRGSSSPVLELKATDISFGPVATKDFKVTAPAGAKVVRIASPANTAAKSPAGKAAGKALHARKAHADVIGQAAVQSHLPFKLAAPNKLVGLPRQSVQLLDWGGSPAALVTYGQGLGGIAVIEQTAPSDASSQSQSQSQSGGGPGLSLPTVSIHGATGQELATALGTVLRVPNGGVEYTVIGSVPPTAAEMAAKALVP